MKIKTISAITILAVIITAPALSARHGRKGMEPGSGPPPWEREHHKGKFFGDPEAMKEMILADVIQSCTISVESSSVVLNLRRSIL